MARKKIHLLPPELRNQIAAGEVVERPASVVKELVENSLDALATEITVHIEDGGQSLISVQDNGTGIPKEELELAVTRHATSKLQETADLSHILSFGFRGEALPSIASVSRFRIVSKTAEENTASELCVNFGDIGTQSPAGLRQGTLIEVRDLFFNIPARLKFLKAPATELKRASDLFMRLALSAENTAMSLYAGSRPVWEFFKDEDRKARLAKIWSPSVIDGLVPVDCEMQGMRLHGFVSNPRSVQPRADRMLLYVNGRAVNDKLMLKAVKQAYAGKITTKDYPQCLLFLDIDPREIDVNVHPAKSEVRFRDEKALFVLMAKAIEKALLGSEKYFSAKDLDENPVQEQPLLPEFGDLYSAPRPQGFWGSADKETRLSFAKNRDETDYSEITEYFQSTKEDFAKTETVSETPLRTFSAPEKSPSPVSAYREQVSFVSEPTEPSAPVFKETNAVPREEQNFSLPCGMEYLGQVAETYLIIKKDNSKLLLLDQHAAHERILYEEIKKKRVHSQNLLCPMELPLHRSEQARYAEVRETLQNLGFVITDNERDGETILKIEAVPSRYDRTAAMGFLKEILAEKLDDLNTVWIRHACKTAIKANTPLDRASAVRLIVQWLAAEEPDNCPHGRPCVIHFDAADLEKLFKRKF